MTEICSICHEELESETTETKCSHIYHKNCLDTWLENRNSCPLCRIVLCEEENPFSGIPIYGIPIRSTIQRTLDFTQYNSINLISISNPEEQSWDNRNFQSASQQITVDTITYNRIGSYDFTGPLPTPINVISPWSLESITPSLTLTNFFEKLKNFFFEN